MANEFILLQNILCFLSLFNLKVEERVFERNIKDVLYSKRPIILLDDAENVVGKLYVKDNNIIIKASIGDKYLTATGNNKDAEDLYCFHYVITKNNKDRLEGSYRVEKDKFKKGVIIKNLVSLYENDELVLKLIFDTIRNKIKIIDNKNNIKVKYVNNSFKLDGENVCIYIENESGYITYSLDKKYDAEKEDKKERIYGYSNISNKQNYTEIEFGFILREMYYSYFDFLEEKKQDVNNYSPDLFEKVSCVALKTLNKEKINSLLNIEFNKFKGISFQKKKDNK